MTVQHLCMTVEAENDLREAMLDTDVLVGSTSHHAIPGSEFLDYPFMVDGAGWEGHIAAARDLEPTIAVAPDVEAAGAVERRLEQAAALDAVADVVVVVPKTTALHPQDVPDRYRLGIPTADFGAVPYSLWAFRGRPVHLLGGSPADQQRAMGYVDAASADTNSMLKAAYFGKVWTADGWVERPDTGWTERVERSYRHYLAHLRGASGGGDRAASDGAGAGAGATDGAGAGDGTDAGGAASGGGAGGVDGPGS